MTEADWLACADSLKMRTHLGDKVSDRKLRLLAAACCRRIWHLLTAERSRKAVETAENLADGCCTEADKETARGNSLQAFFDNCSWHHTTQTIAQNPAAEAAHLVVDERPDFALLLVEEAEKDGSKDSALVRDIFGNPFRAVACDPAWRTATVVSLAQGIYEDRAFGRLPILADALEDAGCDNVDILNHCRQPGEHVRGCWCVDAILGKS